MPTHPPPRPRPAPDARPSGPCLRGAPAGSDARRALAIALGPRLGAPALPRAGLTLAVAVGVVAVAASAPCSARAQARADRPPATQALPTDRTAPHWDLALSVDVLGVALADAWAGTGEVALHRFVGARLTAGYLGTRVAQLGGALVGAGVRLRPLGAGVDGPYVGCGLDVRFRGDTSIEGTAELGWSVVWRGLVVGAGAALAWRLGSGDEAADAAGGGKSVGPGAWAALGGALRLGVFVGWAWR